MNTNWRTHCFVIAFSACAFFSRGIFASELDRDYRMGDDLFEGAAADSSVSITYDSQGVTGEEQLVDLTAVNTPTYRSINALGRPDGGTGLAIEFNSGQQEYLHNYNLNDPDQSYSHTHVDGTLNYNEVFDRGLQFWVRPTSTAVQSLVMDSNQHGVRINSNGKFSMRYANVDFESTVTVTPNTWYHIEVVRPNTFTNGSRMFVNGVAVAAAPGGYNADASHLAVGSNTAGDQDNFTGGTAEFFSGIIDDLEMFVIGQAPLCGAPECVPNRPAHDYGPFDFATDNGYADFRLTGVPGDLNHSGGLTTADKDAFIAGWLDRKVLNGLQIGDLSTFEQGDINFDGITNLADLVLMQGALSGAGMGGITDADLYGGPVPEASSLVLVLSTIWVSGLLRTNRRRFKR
jgi:Concanavalin A-like lectin/glucanases superfamily